MGKTYRYDSEYSVCSFRGRKKMPFPEVQEVRDDILLNGGNQPDRPYYEGFDWETGKIDIDWALKRMEKRISCVVDGLVKGGFVPESEREDYIAKYNYQIVKYAGNYNPHHVGKSGRKSSPLHYLRVIESGVTMAVYEYAKNIRRFVSVPMASLAEGQEDGSTSDVIERTLSDGCRSVRNLWLRMDLNTLSGMLTDIERMTLYMLLIGCTQSAVADAITKRTGKLRDRDHVRKVVLLHIQEKARRCGFCPAGEEF